MLESRIEKQFRIKVEAVGGKAFKFQSPSNNGVPDRIVLLKGKSYFVELKSPGKDLRPLQKAVSRKFNKLGFTVYVIDSLEKVDSFIEKIKYGGDLFHD